MKHLHVADVLRYPAMTTEELREAFLLCDFFQPGHIDLAYVDIDRTILGSAVPATEPLQLPNDPDLRAAFFLERRELGVLNIGGAGSVQVDGESFRLDNLDALYIGRGNRLVEFHSRDAQQPAEFYLLSYPAHAAYPTTLVHSAEIKPVLLGQPETANRREITKLIHLEGTRSCQLVMGYTKLASGSVWNTMPPHTHMRRSEIYLYFNLAEAHRVVHLMGPAHQTRSLIIANKQIVVSPGWSIHAGVGTGSYTFCWGMGGENQDYTDMDQLAIADLL